MQNIHKIQISVGAFALTLAFGFFTFTSSAFAQVIDHTGTLRICSVLATSGGALASADSSVPTGSFSLSLATTTDFSSPVLTHTFDAQTFAHNTTVDGVPMHCTDAVSVPFGQYYYNNIVMNSAWHLSKYFDSVGTFSLASPSLYTNGLFTTDTSDDVLINTASDGLVIVNETTSNRTVIVLNTFTPVLETPAPLPPAQCLPGVNMIANPGFEYPVVTNQYGVDWMSTVNLPHFFWTSYDTITPFVEIQAGYTEGAVQWLAHGGSQYAEIDTGTKHDTSQVLATIPGNTYTISYWASPRPNQSAQVNIMNVSANGLVLGTYTAAGSVMTDWSAHTYTFTATTTQTRISFTQGQDTQIGEGVFLDEVEVNCSPRVISTPVLNQCVLPDTLGDTTSEIIGASYGPLEKVVQTMLAENGIALNAATDQKEYQSWALKQGTTTIEIQYLDGEKAGSEVFGYYLNNDISTFIPVFASGPNSATAYPHLPEATKGQKFTIHVKGSSIQFAAQSVWGGDHYNSTVNSVNESGADRVLSYDVPNSQAGGEYILAFEGLKISASDSDYNDQVIKISFAACDALPSVNTAPTIALVGANPIILTVGGTFTDPGATAHDAEEGNLTNHIVTTGTVNSQTPGTYVLTYTVTDNGGLSASTIRTVIVLPVAACSATANMISNGGFEHPVVVNPPQNWTSIHLNTPGLSWTSYDTSVYPYIEFQAGYTELDAHWMPHTGVQYAEIDGGTNHDVSQVLATIPGNTYTLSYWLSPRPNLTTATNVMNVFANGVQIDTYTGNGLETTVWSQKTVTFTATTTVTRISFTQGQNIQTGVGVFLDDVSVICNPNTAPVNTPPTITLIGANPASLTVGQAWVEPGATATDLEDGNITNKIVVTGTVNTAVAGTYPLVYTVTDTGGLSASTTRQVIVSPAGGGGGVTTGSITFCSIYANTDNVIATSTNGLPTGTFLIKLASSTDIANSTIQTKTWTASAFAPNKKVISTLNDADCVTYSDLPLGTYYYSELGVNGQQWIVSTTSPKYNDQLTTPVNNVFDFFPYSGELFTATTTDDVSRNVNADGQIVVSADRREHTLVLLTQYGAATTTPPVIPPECTVNCSNGGPSTPPACTANCGGGGGGGNGPIVTSLAITNEKVVEITPGVALVTWNTNLPSTKEVGYGNASQPASFIVSPFGYPNATARVISPLETIHSYTIAIESGKTYYFRPVSTDFKTTVAGIELVLNPGTGGGNGGGGIGGNGGGNGGSPTSCYYLYDWLKKGWNNNPVEVKKLQVFLRDLEGYPVEVTGIYDDQTITSLNAFQMRYKTDVLTPWGHTAPTSFTYITTKKKVNEIYCKMAFPVTAQEQAEIDAFRAFLLGLQSAGVTIEPPTEAQTNQPPFIDTTEVGVLPGLSTSTPPTKGQGTLAGSEANSTSTIGQLTANVIASSKKIGNFMAALFTWPWDWAKGWFGGNDDLECAPTSVFSNWFNWILVIIILTMAYLWYRERQENKKAAKLNEELELLNK